LGVADNLAYIGAHQYFAFVPQGDICGATQRLLFDDLVGAGEQRLVGLLGAHKPT
jgi:hypothetical protein